MTKHLSSKWRDPRIKPYKLSLLTPMDLHNDDRWITRDLPSIQANGLYYPILLYKETLEWWNTKYKGWYSGLKRHATPIINDDELIHLVKMGSNRYQCAVHLGYDSIDAIMFNTQEDCIKLGAWFRDCDPLNNKNALPYSGLYGYK
jgi:hypothetical protein